MPDSLQYNFNIYYLSEHAVTVEFGNVIADDVLHTINGFNQLIHQQPLTGFITTVPAYTTLSVFYDPMKVMRSGLPGKDNFEKVSSYLQNLAKQTSNTRQAYANENLITIPVCYGGTFGPDLPDVARLHQLTEQEVINLHSKAVYRVYMIGFVPGFAYLGGLPPALATPRKATPRQAVPAGSVGIAGKQTGIYPLQTPGGWQIIGQTPYRMFNSASTQPALLKSGDKVVFKPVPHHEFNRHRN